MRWEEEEEVNGTAQGGRKERGRGRGESLRKEAEGVRWTVVRGRSSAGEDGGTVKWRGTDKLSDRKHSVLAFLIRSIEADTIFSLHCNAKLK